MYASTDKGYLFVKPSQDGTRYVIDSADLCLEFGVGPNGYSVSYATLDASAWNFDRYLPEGQSVPPDRIWQDLWDTDAASLLYPSKDTSTMGETEIDEYPRIRPWSLWLP